MKRRILSIVLCLSMLLSCVALFSSCKKGGDGEPVVSKKTAEIDLTDYNLVYASDLSSNTRLMLTEISTAIKEFGGVNVRAMQDEEEDVVSTDDLEILVGNTYRKETEKTLKGIKNGGWAIRVFKNKIVIVGTNDFLTRVALAYFVSNYMVKSAFKSSTLTLNKKVLVSKLGTLSFAEDGEGLYQMVFDDRVDGTDNGGPDAYSYEKDTNPTTGGPDADYTYTVVDGIRTTLAKAFGVRSSTMPNKMDNGPVSDYEILVGNMDEREDVKEELLKLEADEYGLVIKNGKIMVLAWNDVTLAAANQLFMDMVSACITEDEDGNVICDVPSACSVKLKLKTEWVTDFPKPEGNGIVLDGTLDVGDNSLEYIYSGTGVNTDSFKAYCDTLEAEGFETIAAESVWEGSSFRTYLNAETGVTLHVYHSAYTYAEDYSECKSVLPSIRIIAASTEHVTTPDSSILNTQSYTNRTQSKITQLKLDFAVGSFGNSYVITLADGTFIIYDGGLGKGGTTDMDNTWAVLNALYKEVFGKDPDSQNPIHVRAWILSHEHADHSTVLTQFLTYFGKKGTFRLDNFLFNGISDSERVNSNNPGSGIHGKHMDSLKNKVTGGFDHIKMHTGQTFYFANLKMEILYTHEDSYPKRLEYFNNSSTIFRTTFMDTGETMIWLGDSERIGGAHILGMYGPTLDSDMVQVAHHGWNGVTTNTYDVIAPEVVWWPTSVSNFNGWTKNPNASNWFHRVDHDIAYNVASVELILVADHYNTTMTFTANSNDYDTLRDVVGNKEIVYCELSTNINSSVVDKRIQPAA
ncbi:MAG: hypothetical protein E7590_05540 [Ruminococcaceae bacterium]|nr:hypothetical protein [Oscillospiraceae bacterium]